MSLHRRRTQQQINLIIIIPVSLQILNYAKTALTIGYSCVEEVLFAVFVDGEALPQYQRFHHHRERGRRRKGEGGEPRSIASSQARIEVEQVPG